MLKIRTIKIPTAETTKTFENIKWEISFELFPSNLYIDPKRKLPSFNPELKI